MILFSPPSNLSSCLKVSAVPPCYPSALYSTHVNKSRRDNKPPAYMYSVLLSFLPVGRYDGIEGTAGSPTSTSVGELTFRQDKFKTKVPQIIKERPTSKKVWFNVCVCEGKEDPPNSDSQQREVLDARAREVPDARVMRRAVSHSIVPPSYLFDKTQQTKMGSWTDAASPLTCYG